MLDVPKEKRSLQKEILLAAVSSLFTGFGFVFFIMWVGNFL
jgi:hypothetical protein